jgi:hypothetical protein
VREVAGEHTGRGVGEVVREEGVRAGREVHGICKGGERGGRAQRGRDGERGRRGDLRSLLPRMSPYSFLDFPIPSLVRPGGVDEEEVLSSGVPLLR